MHIQNRSQPRGVAASALVVTVLLALSHAMTATAQDRMPPLTEAQMTPEQRAAVEVFKEARNTDRVGGPFMVLLRSPEMMNRARNVGDYVRFRSALPPRLSEFVILLTARHWTQNYEWNAHAPIAEREGLDAAIIEAVADGRRPAALADDEAAVYDFCMELLRTHGVSDPTYARMVSHLGEKGVIDAIGIMGYYQLLAMVMNTARTPLPDGVEPGLPAFPR
jgi:4-carboxymuconolactone decarboxylase